MIVLQYNYTRLEVDGELQETSKGFSISNFSELKIYSESHKGGRLPDHVTYNSKSGVPREIHLINGKLLIFGDDKKNS